MSIKATWMVAAPTTAGFATAVSASPVYTPSNPDLNAETASLSGLDLRSEQCAKLALSRTNASLFRIILTGASALSAAIVLGASANAAGLDVRNDEEGGVIKLQYAEADLHTPQGVKALAARIRLAADRACRAEALYASNEGDQRDCRDKAVARTIKDLKAPLLAAALGVPGRQPAVASR